MIEDYLKNSKIITDFKKMDFSYSINNTELSEVIRNNMKDGNENFDVYEVTYLSDGLHIKGFITLPKDTNLKIKNKTSICLRGGHDNYGKLMSGFTISKGNLYSTLPRLGYITFYTQYRGGASGEGFDEYGGQDINDVIRLFDIIEEFEFCDKNNVVIMGSSRGGSIVYQLLTRDLPIGKAIVQSSATDYHRSLNDGWREGWREYFVENNFFDISNVDELNRRSAVSFYKDIKNVPILILHGTADENIKVQDSIDIHNLLPQSKLILYEGDDHLICKHRAEMFRDIKDFLAN